MITLKINECKFTIISDGYTDCHEEGLAPRGELIGIGNFTIPAEHRQLMSDHYGCEVHEIYGINMDEEDWPEGSDYNGYDADLFIHWIYAISHTLKYYTIRGKWEHVFWPIHDLMHAKKDFYANTFHCSAQGELERFQDAYRIGRQQGLTFDEEFMEFLVDAYNTRTLGCDWRNNRKAISINTIKQFKRIYV
jgi:hypothetical protein